MTKIEEAKRLLDSGVVLAVVNGEKSYTSDLRGVSALLSLYNNNPMLIKGAYIADKVIGKAAALLMVLGKTKEVFALTISKNAVSVFEKNGIPYSYLNIVDFIKNREGTGRCPLEQCVLTIDDPILAFNAINNKLEELRLKNENNNIEKH